MDIRLRAVPSWQRLLCHIKPDCVRPILSLLSLTSETSPPQVHLWHDPAHPLVRTFISPIHM